MVPSSFRRFVVGFLNWFSAYSAEAEMVFGIGPVSRQSSDSCISCGYRLISSLFIYAFSCRTISLHKTWWNNRSGSSRKQHLADWADHGAVSNSSAFLLHCKEVEPKAHLVWKPRSPRVLSGRTCPEYFIALRCCTRYLEMVVQPLGLHTTGLVIDAEWQRGQSNICRCFKWMRAQS